MSQADDIYQAHSLPADVPDLPRPSAAFHRSVHSLKTPYGPGVCYSEETFFSKEQMWDYARKAIAAERERCAQIAERHYIPGHSVAGPGFAAKCAEAIRNQEKA